MQRFYDALNANAVDSEEGEYRVFRGKTTAVWNSLDLASPYYHKAMKLLQEMGSIEQIQRGARHVESVLYLHSRPVLSDYLKLDPDAIKSANTERQRVHEITTDARISNIEQNIGGLNIQEVISDHEIRLQQLEARLASQPSKTKQGEVTQ